VKKYEHWSTYADVIVKIKLVLVPFLRHGVVAGCQLSQYLDK